MVLMGQEHITEQMFQNENMVTSGFIPRLLFATAETPMLYRDKNRPAISEDARNNYRDVVVSVLQKHWIQEDESAPITVGMTDEAQDAIDDFHNSYVDRGNTALSDAKRSLHRIAEQATRIALIFHVAKVYGSMTGLDSDVTDTNEPINLSTVQAAIKVTEWSLQSYLEYSRPGREDALDELESEVMSKAKKIGKPFTVRDMQRKIRSKKFTGSEYLTSILSGLVRRGNLSFLDEKYSLPTKKA
jgi:glycine cleavage system H lipoate-binding protein